MTTAAEVVNGALELIAAQTTITGTNPAFDGSVAGNAAGVLYTPAVQLCLREISPSFARRTAALVLSGGSNPPPWTISYTYPADCLRARRLRPLPGYNTNDPQPLRGAISYDNGLAVKVIVAGLAGLYLVYTSANPSESQWDAAFTEAVKRRLASPLAMALAGRPDFAKELLDEAERFASMAELLDEV